MKEASEIEFQVRSGKREEIPEVQGDETRKLVTTIIKACWNQNPSERPPFQQIDPKLSSFLAMK